MLTTSYALNALLMILFPILVGIFLARTFKLSWRLFFFGGLAFILAQLFHLPLNAVLTRVIPGLESGGSLWLRALILGFTAAITEEIARYSILRNNLKEARSWKAALMYGAGHGGFEAIILGILAGLTLVNMIFLYNNPDALTALPADKMILVQEQLSKYWSMPWYWALMGVVERISTLIIQISLAVIVMQVFLKRNKNWLWIAVGWHWLVDAVAMLSAAHFSIAITELIIGVMAFTGLIIIFYFRPIESQADDSTLTTDN